MVVLTGIRLAYLQKASSRDMVLIMKIPSVQSLNQLQSELFYLLLSLEGWSLRQLDVQNAFLHGV